MPGQFRHLIPALAATRQHRVACIGRQTGFSTPGVGVIAYTPPYAGREALGHPFLRPAEDAVLAGQQVAYFCDGLARNGFRPDLVVAHPGWGESLFVKEVWPDARLLLYCEFFYRSRGVDTDFRPGTAPDLTARSATRTRNAHLLLALDAADWGLSPTHWQRGLHPDWLQPRISVIHDGIDGAAIAPDPEARLELPCGTVLHAGDEVLTYAARNLEPHRGFPEFMRALPHLLAARPAVRVVIAGADGASYGPVPEDGRSWRQVLSEEIGLPHPRVHLTGTLPRGAFLRLLQVSALHVYASVPFVLSWSVLEAMAAGCLVLGSDTAPVREVIEDGRNGILADMRDPEALARAMASTLANRAGLAALRTQARQTVLDRYALTDCLPRQIALVERLAAGVVPEA